MVCGQPCVERELRAVVRSASWAEQLAPWGGLVVGRLEKLETEALAA